MSASIPSQAACDSGLSILTQAMSTPFKSKIALSENDRMIDFPQDSPNVVYIIVSRNETFGYITHLNFLMMAEAIFAKIASATHLVIGYPQFTNLLTQKIS